jgi:hypothetical protein
MSGLAACRAALDALARTRAPSDGSAHGRLARLAGDSELVPGGHGGRELLALALDRDDDAPKECMDKGSTIALREPQAIELVSTALRIGEGVRSGFDHEIVEVLAEKKGIGRAVCEGLNLS